MRTTTTDGALAVKPLGLLVVLQGGRARYQQLSAVRLKTARLAAGWDQEHLAESLTDVLGMAVSTRQIAAWEDGEEEFFAGVMNAAYDVMAISEAELIGLGNPDVEQINRLAVAVARVRALLNDPTALARRVSELMDGTAKPLLVLALVGLTAFRMFAGPMTPQYRSLPPRNVAVSPLVIPD